LLLCLCFSLGRKDLLLFPLGFLAEGFPLAKRENFRNFLLLLLKATGGVDIKKGPYPGPFPCESDGYPTAFHPSFSIQAAIRV